MKKRACVKVTDCGGLDAWPLAAARGVSDQEAEPRLAGNSIRKLVDAEEVAWVGAFLASPRSIALNGHAIACGGRPPGLLSS